MNILNSVLIRRAIQSVITYALIINLVSCSTWSDSVLAGGATGAAIGLTTAATINDGKGLMFSVGSGALFGMALGYFIYRQRRGRPLFSLRGPYPFNFELPNQYLFKVEPNKLPDPNWIFSHK